MNILIAEDNIPLQKATKMFLEFYGNEVDVASNGRETFELARENEGKYDICLMDITMPVMDGHEATQLIRSKLKYLPIMAFTGNVDIQDKYHQFGMDDYLEKPCDLEMLNEKINELTVKTIKVDVSENNLFITKEMPMDTQHAKELRELKSQDLVKVKFDDISGAEVTVHKNIINKIVKDFNIKKQFVSTFLNRNPDKPTKCILFGNNCRMPQLYLDNDDYNDELRMENEEMKKCSEMILKIEKDE
jgi:CheY-like chemotaxis protein